MATGDQVFKAAYDARALAVLGRLQAVADGITGEEVANKACPSCTESGDHHNWSCLKRMKCRKGPEENWETEPPGDPQDVPGGYQAGFCEKCCTVISDHLADDYPHPESRNCGVQFALSQVLQYASE